MIHERKALENERVRTQTQFVFWMVLGKAFNRILIWNTRFTLFILKIDLENCVVRGNKYENDTIFDAASITKHKKSIIFFVFPSCKFSVEGESAVLEMYYNGARKTFLSTKSLGKSPTEGTGGVKIQKKYRRPFCMSGWCLLRKWLRTYPQKTDVFLENWGLLL